MIAKTAQMFCKVYRLDNEWTRTNKDGLRCQSQMFAKYQPEDNRKMEWSNV